MIGFTPFAAIMRRCRRSAGVSGDRPCDGDAVAVAEAEERVDFPADLLDGFVAIVQILPVAAVAGKIALGCGFQPRDGVVGQRPGKPVVVAVIQTDDACMIPSSVLSAGSVSRFDA